MATSLTQDPHLPPLSVSPLTELNPLLLPPPPIP